MKKIRERTYIHRLLSFIIGIFIGWIFYVIIFTSGSGEELTDKQDAICGILSFVTMIIYEFVAEYNYLKKLELLTASLYSNISIYKGREKKLLSKAQEIIYNFLHHESDIQKSVASLRTGNEVKIINDKQDISLRDLKVTVESYPNLKSDKHISKILDQLEESQDTILNSKILFNEYVTYYNAAIANFPAILISKLLKLKPLEFYVEKEFDDI